MWEVYDYNILHVYSGAYTLPLRKKDNKIDILKSVRLTLSPSQRRLWILVKMMTILTTTRSRVISRKKAVLFYFYRPIIMKCLWCRYFNGGPSYDVDYGCDVSNNNNLLCPAYMLTISPRFTVAVRVFTDSLRKTIRRLLIRLIVFCRAKSLVCTPGFIWLQYT